jgi:hypothetical protein
MADAPAPAPVSLSRPLKKMGQDDKHEGGEVEPADGILADPRIALMAP